MLPTSSKSVLVMLPCGLSKVARQLVTVMRKGHVPNDWGCNALYAMPSKWGYLNLGLSCNGSRCGKEDTTSTMAGSIMTAMHSRLKWDKFLYMHGMPWEVMMQSPKVIQNGVDGWSEADTCIWSGVPESFLKGRKETMGTGNGQVPLTGVLQGDGGNPGW